MCEIVYTNWVGAIIGLEWRHLLVCFLLDHLFGLLLLCLKEGAHPLESIGGQDQRSGDHSLSASDVALASNLLVFIVVGVEGPVFGLAGFLEWPVYITKDGTLDFFCLGLDDGNSLVKLGEEEVTKLINLDDIGFCV